MNNKCILFSLTDNHTLKLLESKNNLNLIQNETQVDIKENNGHLKFYKDNKGFLKIISKNKC